MTDEYTIYNQTGWMRKHKSSLCQEDKILLQLTKFCFDIADEDFRYYVKSRLGIDLNIALKSNILIYQMTTDEEMKSLFTFKDDLNEGRLKAHKILKAKLQDCWELFKSTSKEERMINKPLNIDMNETF